MNRNLFALVIALASCVSLAHAQAQQQRGLSPQFELREHREGEKEAAVPVDGAPRLLKDRSPVGLSAPEAIPVDVAKSLSETA